MPSCLPLLAPSRFCQALGKRLGAGPESLRQAGIPTPPFRSFSAADIKAKPLSTLPANSKPGWPEQQQPSKRPGYLLSASTRDCGIVTQRPAESKRTLFFEARTPQSGGGGYPQPELRLAPGLAQASTLYTCDPHLILTTTLPKWFGLSALTSKQTEVQGDEMTHLSSYNSEGQNQVHLT